MCINIYQFVETIAILIYIFRNDFPSIHNFDPHTISIVFSFENTELLYKSFFLNGSNYIAISINVILFSHHFRYVFVECRPGLYGSTCSVNCSSHCYKKACDQYSKECLYGCTPGYQKPDCLIRKMYLQPSLFKFSQ